MTRTQIRNQTGIIQVTINPELAEEWLTALNRDNRPLVESYLTRLVEQAKEGNFLEYTGETIKFDPDGLLLDGQHRLTAIVRAGITLTLWVAFQVPREAFKVIDTGRRRSAGDTLYVEGVETYHSLTAAAIKYLINWNDTNTVTNASSVRHHITNDKVLTYYRNNQQLLDTVIPKAASIYDSGAKLIPASMIAAFMCYYNNDLDTEEFFKKVSTGLQLSSERDPVYLLRSLLIAHKANPNTNMNRSMKVLYVAKALQLYRNKKQVRRLIVRSNNQLTDFLERQHEEEE